MYGPGRPLRAWNSSAVSSVKAGPLIYQDLVSWIFATNDPSKPYRFSCTPGLFPGDLLDCTLDLRDIHRLVVHLNDAAKDGTHFAELVLIARDEIELGQGHDGLAEKVLAGSAD